eukprot:9312879-Pyramimonas_sp.AAC.1
MVHSGAFAVTYRMESPSVHQLGPEPSPQCAPPVCAIPCVRHQAFPVFHLVFPACTSPVCTTSVHFP